MPSCRAAAVAVVVWKCMGKRSAMYAAHTDEEIMKEFGLLDDQIQEVRSYCSRGVPWSRPLISSTPNPLAGPNARNGERRWRLHAREPRAPCQKRLRHRAIGRPAPQLYQPVFRAGPQPGLQQLDGTVVLQPVLLDPGANAEWGVLGQHAGVSRSGRSALRAPDGRLDGCPLHDPGRICAVHGSGRLPRL